MMNKRFNPIKQRHVAAGYLLLFLFMSGTASSQLYVSPSGSDSNPGTFALPFRTLGQALSVAGPDSLIYLRGGTYSTGSTVMVSVNGLPGKYIRIWAYPGELPLFDFSAETSGDGISVTGTYCHLRGLEVTGAYHNGINVSGHYNIIENCSLHDNRNSGFQMGSSSGTSYPSHNRILNCDSYRNFDSPIGGNADGFAVKWNIGSGNILRDCRAYNNSDDGWDFWMADSTIELDSCWAFRNGVDLWHTGSVNGNGNGFKVGGNFVPTPHILKNCVSFDNAGNTGRGFDENNNLAGQTLYNCIAYRNGGDNYHFTNSVTAGQHIIKNCISYVGSVNITSGTQQTNSWQGFTVSSADFGSLDTSLAVAARNADGSLPSNSLFHLASGSPMIDAGVYAEIPYNGIAPDLGAFEFGGPGPSYTITASAGAHGSISPGGSVSVLRGGIQTFTMVPDPGYSTDSVIVNGVYVGSVQAYEFSNVRGDSSIRVTFLPNLYALTVLATAGGTVAKNPDQSMYSFHSSVQLTASPAGGYDFTGWSGNLTGTANPVSVFVDSTMSITANFAASTATAGSFRSHQTGNWSNVASWERFDGSVWVTPAPNAPKSADGTITIRNGDTVTVDANVSVDQVLVNTGGNVIVGAGKTLTIANAADSVDMSVSGTLNNFGTVTATGRLSFENGGTYIHSVPSGGTTLPSSTWRTGSTCRIDSSSGSSPTNLNTQNLFNLTWNATTASANGGPNFGDGAIIAGDLTVTSSNGFQFRIVSLSGGQTKNVTIQGNVNVNGSGALLTSTGSGADTLAKAIINVDGNVNVTAGQWSLVNSSNAYSEWKIKGNVSVTGGTLQSGSSGWSGRRTVNFSGGTAQTFTISSPGTLGSAMTTFKVSNGSAVQVNFPFTLMSGGALNLQSGQFITSATNIITIPATGTLLGGGISGYVNGPLAYTIASSSPATKFFPIGKGSAYRPVTLTVNQDAATATTYTAEMFNGTPPPRTLPAGLTGVSSVRYYTITKGAGANLSPTLGAVVQLNYDVDDGVTDANLLRIAKDDGSGHWISTGGSGTANITGSITSNAFFSFSDFVLATADTGTPVLPPAVTTASVSYISTTFATSGGNVTNDGGAAVTSRGACWNTSGAPTVSDQTTSDGTGAGAYTSSITGLTPGVTYHLRAYATNSSGTGYGNELTFLTLASVVPPSVTTTSVTNIQVTTAVSGGTVTDWGGDSVTARGVCWNTAGAPVIGDSHSSDGKGLGSFVSGLAHLSGGLTYHVRAYATNSAGTGYGGELSFTTQTPQPDTTVVVAHDGSGNYTTVQAAFRAVRANYTGHWTIVVKKGVYYEKDTLTSGKNNVVLVGEDRDSTIITYDDYADRYGSGNPGTSGSFTIAIDASDFTAKNITFRNTYSAQPGVSGTQAVALRTQGDRHEYINCKILGFQDTYYTWGGSGTGRMYHKGCFIEGTVDFIFGRNIVVFDSCTIHEIRNGGTLTAGSTDASSLYGYVFRNCTILADSIGYDGVPTTSFYLGRPWQGSPRTVFINCSEPARLNAAGWLAWNVTPALYAEFNGFGPGSSTSGRVNWSSQLSGPTAATYSLSNIFARSSASSGQILFDWMPASAISDLPLAMRIISAAAPHGSITPAGTINIPYGGSQTCYIVSDSGYHADSVIVDGANVGSTLYFSFANVTSNHSIGAFFSSGEYTHHPVVESGWNLLSLPSAVADARRMGVYPTALSRAFWYVGGYVTAETLAAGRGYWLKFPAVETLAIGGSPLLLDTIPVSQGWNMIGSISVPIAANSIISDPPAIVTGNIFGYNGSYVVADTVYPGGGYWIKVSRDGSLILGTDDSGSSPVSRIRIAATSELPPGPPADAGLTMGIPQEFALDQNYPNPFNPVTVIRYQLPVQSHVTLKIYNLLGQEVLTLVNEIQNSGNETAHFDASAMASGMYFYRLDAVSTTDPGKTFTQVRKMILTK